MAPDGPSDYDRRTILRAAGAFGALFGTGLAGASSGRDPDADAAELLVGVSPSEDVSSAVRSALPADAAVARSNETLAYAVVELPEEVPAEARETVREALAAADGIEYVEDNAAVRACYVPDDPRYRDQYAPQQVGCEAAWDATLGDEDVLISVVDQGIQYDHPNLEGNMDDRIGRDFVDGGSDPYPVSDDDAHGTHVAGVAAAGTDDGTGHAGISNCSLLSARALDSSGTGLLSDIADAIQWSADQGADVINLSLGGGGYSRTMANACQYAHDRGAVLVAAAGNEYGDDVMYPAAYDTVIAVSSLDGDGSLSSFSNVGPEIELAAPGSRVLSTVPTDDYALYSGTSIATPVVAGVAGLVRSAHPDLSNEEVRRRLRDTAADVGLSSSEQGYGRVDADAAVNTGLDDGGSDGDDAGSDDGESDEPECGAETVTASVENYLTSWWGDGVDRYRYGLQTANPCGTTLELEVPERTDLDLYATRDGRRPTRDDHDAASTGDGNEELVLELSGDEEIRILVAAERGGGYYTLSVEERGT